MYKKLEQKKMIPKLEIIFFNKHLHFYLKNYDLLNLKIPNAKNIARIKSRINCSGQVFGNSFGFSFIGTTGASPDLNKTHYLWVDSSVETSPLSKIGALAIE